MTKGVVSFWSEKLGFGFIQPDDGSETTFVHGSEAKKAGLALAKGHKVTFERTYGATPPTKNNMPVAPGGVAAATALSAA